ncbi:MAG: hypothetical protein VZS44_03125 [Bacilli bacterium]|nr:hypothetical protein [Bacilli bacterium]
MFTKKNILLITKINLFIITAFLTLALFPITFSKYQSTATGNVNSNIAFYLFKADYQVQRIKLADLEPSNTPHVYTFSISNQNNNKTSDVDIEYTLKVVTTTNLPLRYQLYENEDYQSNNSTNLITQNNSTIAPDEDGTYFQTFEFDQEELLYTTPKTNNYTLVVYFDETNTNAKYQDTIESVRIIVESRQIIE